MNRTAVTENGIVRGLPAGNARITAYKGIPFAAPPTGENRWRAPQPCKNWDGILDAYKFGPIAIQDTPGYGDNIYVKEWSFDRDVEMSEDCLYLNVFSPAQSTDEKLPVYLWYFGGGLQWGYSYEMEFDAENLAKKGVIVVTAGYRLGVLGFLAHPEITREQPDRPSNFGNLDQQAALRWVYRNIAGFGGDPENITIGGQSAGGGSVMTQITCEENFDLIKHAIIMSGVIRDPSKDIPDPILIPVPIETAEKNGEDFFRFLGVNTLAEARALDALKIRDAYAQFAASHPRFSTCIDHTFCKQDTFKAYVSGHHADIDIMAGNTQDEFPVVFSHEGTERKSCGIEYAVKALFTADKALSSKKNGYYYCFDSDIPGDDHPGTFHSVDLWFFFESLKNCWRPMVGRHYDLARKMCTYWANFIKTGNPNGFDVDGSPLPEWKPCTADERGGLRFTGDGPVPEGEKDPLVTAAICKLLR